MKMSIEITKRGKKEIVGGDKEKGVEFSLEGRKEEDEEKKERRIKKLERQTGDDR